MKLSRTSGYALRAVVYMATEPNERIIASHLIARAQGLPERFLLKTLKPLVSRGLLYSVKGPHGGYRLAKSPRDITLLDVVEAVDGPISGQISFNEGNGGLDRRLETVCKQIAEQTRERLGKIRISDLAKK